MQTTSNLSSSSPRLKRGASHLTIAGLASLVAMIALAGTAPAQDRVSPTLDLAKTPDGGQAHVEDPFNWTHVITNTGTVDAENVTLFDSVPHGLDLLASSPPTCVEGNHNLTCELGTLPAGERTFVNVTVAVTGDICERLDNFATIDAAGEPTGTLSDSAHVEPLCPDAIVTKTALETPLTPPGVASFEIHVENEGPGNATPVTLTDPLHGGNWTLTGPDTAACQPFDGAGLHCDFGTLEPGETRTVTIARPTSTRTDCGTLANTAFVITRGDLEPENDHAAAEITVDCEPRPPPSCPTATAVPAEVPLIHVIWSDVEGADGFRVYRAVGDEPFEKIAAFDGSDVHDLVDDDIEPGQTYRYTVTSVIDDQESQGCPVAEATAVPVFPTPLAWVAAAALGLTGYIAIQRRSG